MFYLHHGNRLNSLAKQLADVHAHCSSDPLVPEDIIVQNAGMANWLSLRIAEHLGIAANLKFSFPAEYMWQLIHSVLDGVPDVEPFRPGILRWRIFQILITRLDEFPELSAYLEDDNQLHAYQLACHLEDLLDRCLFYRPHWIKDWEAGKAPHWQARLWRKLVEDGDAVHWVKLQEQFLHSLDARGGYFSSRRVLIFGIAQLSPGYLQLLWKTARYMDIHVFLVNPCQQYWGDIVTEKIKLKADDLVSDYLEIGNPLLASMGRQCRDFFELLISLEPDDEQACFEENPADTMLAAIQNDILNLNNRTQAKAKADSVSVPKALADGSISIHSCHTPMREIEVLYDQLLDLFNHDAGLLTEDIIVMMPSIQTYASFVDAVFASREHQIPYVIADRTLIDNNLIADILNAVLELPDSRYEINRVLALLDYQPVRKRFKLTEDDVVQVRDWCIRTNIRWGVDASMRDSLGLPATMEHTWLAGIQRMLLGNMLNSDAMYNDILPYTDIEGSLSVVLGRFVEFAQALFQIREWSDQKALLTTWIDQISKTIQQLIMVDDQLLGSTQEIDLQLQKLASQSEQAGYSEKISFSLVKELVAGVVSQCSQKERFAAAGVTFCELMPMRSIPFKVVCLVGMSDGLYPSPVPQHSFDLLVDDGYRRGDRSRRIEERYLFLESMMAANEKLYISYVGKDVRKNTTIPPSVLVSELIDYIEQGFEINRDQLITQHPLQAFSSRYYAGDSSLFTYSDYPINNQSIQAESAFFETSLEQQTLSELSLQELIRFIQFPVRYFLEQRLGIKSDSRIGELPEREPFDLDLFDAVELRQAIAQKFGQSQGELIKRIRALGLLPHGAQGQRKFEEEYEIVSHLIERVSEVTTESVIIQENIDDLLLFGTVENVSEQGIVHVSFGQLWCQDILEHWINHLALSVSSQHALLQSTIIHPHGESGFRPVDNPSKHLKTLLHAYQSGVNLPLHFMPKSGYEYAKKTLKADTKVSPLEAARKIWVGDTHRLGEGQKPAYQLAFRGIDVMDADFEYWAKAIWLPVLGHFQE